MISISPDAGQSPYPLYLGISQNAGHSQSPLGSFALIFTLPNLNEKLLIVLKPADCIGLMMLELVPILTQPLHWFVVQSEKGLVPHKSNVPDVKKLSSYVSLVNVGFKYKHLSLI